MKIAKRGISVSFCSDESRNVALSSAQWLTLMALRVRTGRDYVRTGCARNNYCDSSDRVARASRLKRVFSTARLTGSCDLTWMVNVIANCSPSTRVSHRNCATFSPHSILEFGHRLWSRIAQSPERLWLSSRKETVVHDTLWTT